MAQPRRRHVRRNALVFLGSFLAHAVVFFLLATEFTKPYPLPEEAAPPVQVELVPEPIEPMPPIPKPIVEPKPLPPTPQPVPQPQPKPQPAPAPQQPIPAAVVKPTASTRVQPNPTLAPAPKPAQAPSPLAPPVAAPTPGPPKAVVQSTVVAAQPQTVAAPKLILHKSQSQAASSLAPAISIPGAVFAPPQAGGGPAGGGGAAGGGGGAVAGLPHGALPGFGSGLRGSLLGCINADVAKLSPGEQARCAERFGEGAKVAPVMDPIGATKRGEINDEVEREDAAQKYRDSTPPSSAEPAPGQPRVGHAPGSD